MRFLLRLLLNGVAVFLAAHLIPGIGVASPGAALAAGIVLGLVNAIIRPVLVLLTLPLTVVTLGLFILVINALLLMFVAAVVPGFTLGGFWTAFWAAIFIGVVSFVTNRLIGRPVK